MKKRFSPKSIIIIVFFLCLTVSIRTFANTTPLWWTILNNLRNEWWTDDEIRNEIEKLWYDASEYLWNSKTNKNNSNNQTLKTTETWRKIINNLRNKWMSDYEIGKAIEDLWYDASWYLWNNWNRTNNISIKISNKNPDINERIKLVIDIDETYTWKVYFSKLQYYNTSTEKRTNIDLTSNKYISDYWDDLDTGYIKFKSSDKWNITISKFIKFAKSGKYRIYAKDNDWNEDYIQIKINSDDENDKDNDSDNSKLALTTNITNPSINEPIDINIKANDYVGKLLLYAKYRELTSSYRITLNNTSTEYFSDYSDTWEDWYYKMTSSDKGKKALTNLIEFKKTWTYRIYAEDKDWYTNFIQIYVKSNDNNTSESNNNTNHSININNNSNNLSEDDEIEELIKELLNENWNNNSTSQNNNNDIEQNEKNIKNSDEEIYISRSCKQYRIQYNQSLWVFTSPDLKNIEYFINKEYLKRYIDSKNPQKENCPQNYWWISTSYRDNSESLDSFIAPNWKVYFISEQNWYFSSNELANKRNFSSISTLKYFIRDHNPLIWMST